MATLTVRSLDGLPEITPGADLGGLIAAAVERAGLALRDATIVAVAHKAVSKSEGAVVALGEVQPSSRARALAAEQGKDPRMVQVVLDQTAELLRAERGVLICRTRLGLVCANAGVDASNAAAPDTVVVLPSDPDASARRLRARLRELTGTAPAVLVTDSFGRAWRHGQCDVAIGCAGLAPLEDWRGQMDSVGRELRATWLAVADAVAGAADLARAKDSREPVVLVDGLDRHVTAGDGPGALALVRPPEQNLFR